MFTKTAIALSIALTLGAASSAFASVPTFDEAEYGYSASAGFDAYAQAGKAMRQGAVVPRHLDSLTIGSDADVNIRNQEERDRWYQN